MDKLEHFTIMFPFKSLNVQSLNRKRLADNVIYQRSVFSRYEVQMIWMASNI